MSAEQHLRIPLADSKIAYARLRGGWNRPLVIFAHGNSASMGDALPYEISKFLGTRGYSVLRFNFYGDAPDARKLAGITLTDQVHDLASITAFARENGAKNITLMGHSFGGLTILMSGDLDVDTAVLLDPAYPTKDAFKTAVLVPELGLYHRPDRRVDYLLNPVMVEQYWSLKPEDFLTGYHAPSLIISAGGAKPEYKRKYLAVLKKHGVEAELVEISEADHGFSTDEAMEQMLKHSLEWLTSRSTA